MVFLKSFGRSKRPLLMCLARVGGYYQKGPFKELKTAAGRPTWARWGQGAYLFFSFPVWRICNPVNAGRLNESTTAHSIFARIV